MPPPDVASRRSETNDCGEGGGPASVVARALCEAPVEGLLEAAQGKSDAGARARRAAVPVYGALDLGTNNCRLLVARPSPPRLSRHRRLLPHHSPRRRRAALGHLSDAAMNRTIDALKICSDKMRRRGVSRSASDRHRGVPDRRQQQRVHRPGAPRHRPCHRDREPGDRGEARRVGLRLADRPQLRLGARLRYRRRQLGADLARSHQARSSLAPLHLRPARSAELHRRLDVLAHRRGQPRRAPWRPRGRPRELRGNGVGRDAGARRFRRRATGFRSRISNSCAHFLGTSGTVTTIAGIHLGLPAYDRNRGSTAAGSARRMCAA